jgi:hypothetical protein
MIQVASYVNPDWRLQIDLNFECSIAVDVVSRIINILELND